MHILVMHMHTHSSSYSQLLNSNYRGLKLKYTTIKVWTPHDHLLKQSTTFKLACKTIILCIYNVDMQLIIATYLTIICVITVHERIVKLETGLLFANFPLQNFPVQLQYEELHLIAILAIYMLQIIYNYGLTSYYDQLAS